jgi:hypothetical protein
MLERTNDAKRTPPPATNPTAASVDALVAREHLRFYREPDPAAWTRLRGGLDRLRDTAAARGIWLVV